MSDPETLAAAFARAAPACDGWSLRQVHSRTYSLSVRDDLALPLVIEESVGAMVGVQVGRAAAYAATPARDVAGLAAAATRARDLARELDRLPGIGPAALPSLRHRPLNRHACSAMCATHGLSETLGRICRRMQRNRVVERIATLDFGSREMLLTSSAGALIHQHHDWHSPALSVVAGDGAATQQRSFGGADRARQGSVDVLQVEPLLEHATRVADEALALLDAAPCPTERMDLLLMPSQMALQIHESIGHPLELDRILGDERNYAGGSFVTPQMFGSYRYGSPLLNVTFDPTVDDQLASYAFDDDGSRAERVHLIRRGILERPLGGALSQRRSGLPGTANSRASDWNRPPMDRMANINIEPGETSLADMIAGIEHGVLMDTNRSWSIDQSRNKFQFGCETARLIRDGQLGPLLRDPGYRGVSATFWRGLSRVGDAASREVLGTRYCGKGEPNQIIMCGHASPPCVFADVEVFGPDTA